jgi:hypothetical protein
MPRRRRSWPSTIRRLLVDAITLAGLAVTSRSQLVAENLFLRKQLALYQERRVKPRRPVLRKKSIQSQILAVEARDGGPV